MIIFLHMAGDMLLLWVVELAITKEAMVLLVTGIVYRYAWLLKSYVKKNCFTADCHANSAQLCNHMSLHPWWLLSHSSGL